jgi:hypothetical protein
MIARRMMIGTYLRGNCGVPWARADFAHHQSIWSRVMDVNSTVGQLRIAAGGFIAFGLMAAAAAVPALSGPMLLFTDLVIWPMDGAQSLASPEARLLCAIGGGLTVGIGVALWMVATRLYPRDPALAHSIMMGSVGSWFAVDSTCSVLAGAPVNALLNVGLFLMIAVPLWRAAKLGTATH